MKLRNNRVALILLLGDLLLFVVALWVTLLVRYSQLPTGELFANHLSAFAIILLAWVVVFFIFDLYRRPTSIFKRELPRIIASAQVINTIIAIIFFYYVPSVGIAPRVNLFIYLFISFVFIVVWRRYLGHYFYRGRQERVILLGESEELSELKNELLASADYNVVVRQESTPDNLGIVKHAIVVFDPEDLALSSSLAKIYQLIFAGATLVTFQDMYETIFQRVPVSAINERWVFNNISTAKSVFYDALKRVIDIAVALPLFIISLVVYPFAFLGIKLSSPGPIFSHQTRVGQNNNPVRLIKFRTMSNANDGGKWGSDNTNRVTKFGAFLRKTRIDELPQLWNVLRGDVSLIGPRPEFPDPVKHYAEAMPYYNVRHLIKPGLSGWAQIYGDHPHHGTDVDKTKNKLSYDLYYVKHRSIWLDISIGLKTLRILLSNKGI
jgi:exopolysaccharide biosynthesis polyprenyl glycosylphosphotransferase